MNFTNSSSKVSLYIDDNKIFIDGILHQITEIKVNTLSFSRFKFGVYEAKINNNILTYTNTLTGQVKSFTKDQIQQELTTQKEIWNAYTVHGNLEVFLSDDKKKIKVNQELFEINRESQEGIYTVYSCEKGRLSISKNERTRKSMWNNIFINLKQ
jgi:hypothetical protein